ncbi:winged helix-turn-helix domain-containing protein [Virgibacillus sp. LDC1]|uniref:ArsR/SmtB family transcription factor n=1 Tax=Paenibacillus lautus TaxID=1401 RepID=UPI002DBF4883|nr:winged helix-turn-helix domain-containing protein [Paenibacillus lautus]MCV4230627.1 winged helix-turn-helix domain-containing protein [Virgibacillus sp. LDC1]MEC0305919.1 winged helix-turn-helix domain-containing protein [Paenibacillus lautus]
MNANPNVAQVASLVSDASRAAILTVLLDGRYHPASELAYMAKIKPQTASFHLSKMVAANLVTVEEQGRHRYYGIRNQEVAQILETLLSITPPVEIRSLNQATEHEAIRQARTCYDHLAGSLGIQLTNSLLNAGVISETENQFTVTEKGEVFFKAFQIDLEQVKRKRRSFTHRCLDWSERRHHLAGALGHALLERLLELNWIQRLPRTRAITITPEGKKGLKETFQIDME